MKAEIEITVRLDNGQSFSTKRTTSDGDGHYLILAYQAEAGLIRKQLSMSLSPNPLDDREGSG